MKCTTKGTEWQCAFDTKREFFVHIVSLIYGSHFLGFLPAPEAGLGNPDPLTFCCKLSM